MNMAEFIMLCDVMIDGCLNVVITLNVSVYHDIGISVLSVTAKDIVKILSPAGIPTIT